ncbi:MAG: MTAP family purine nucleoside phosphorylase [Bdellovibrionaceae bacterium]|nr:MTAP family purine nucleoside phosphorylase [Pseudobdellovibrionaceae bacterium]
MFAIIGGSGFEKFEAFETIEDLDRQTPFGKSSSGIKRVKINNIECLFLSRHGENHEDLPSELNYRANIFALKKYGAKAIISFSAVGSLRKEFKPGDMVVPHQYIDRTKGIRKHSFLGNGIVGHISLAKPICEVMSKKTQEICKNKKWDNHFGQTYVCIEGPYFSTKAESNSYRQMGADIIGMTHFPEYALAREASLSYLPCCFVTDYDCWDDSIPHVTLQEVIEVMRANNSKAFELATQLLPLGEKLFEGTSCPEGGLRTGLMTPRDLIPHEAWTWLDVLLA